MRRLPTSLVAALFSATLLAAPAPPLHSEVAPEYAVKAAFLYNFAKFVDWPPERASESPFVIGLLGTNPFGAALEETLAGKQIDDRPLELRQVKVPGDARDCHILFVSASERGRYEDIFEIAKSASVVTVGETDDFAARGGTIRFLVEERRVRFEINPASARRSGLRISSQLLKLARITEEER